MDNSTPNMAALNLEAFADAFDAAKLPGTYEITVPQSTSREPIVRVRQTDFNHTVYDKTYERTAAGLAVAVRDAAIGTFDGRLP